LVPENFLSLSVYGGKRLDPNEDLVIVQRCHEIYFWPYLCVKAMSDEMCAQAAGYEGILYCGGSAAAQNWTCSAHQRKGKSHVNELQCCASWMLIPDPEFYPSRIQKKQKGGEIILPFFCSHKLFYFWSDAEKKLSQLTKNYSTFYPKNCY